MDTNAIINAAMQQLVSTVADEVIRRLKAETVATATLEPETLAASLLHLLEFDADIREAVRDVTDEKFDDLESQVSRLDEKLDDLGPAVVDADNSEFQDAVCSVIRNHI